MNQALEHKYIIVIDKRSFFEKTKSICDPDVRTDEVFECSDCSNTSDSPDVRPCSSTRTVAHSFVRLSVHPSELIVISKQIDQFERTDIFVRPVHPLAIFDIESLKTDLENRYLKLDKQCCIAWLRMDYSGDYSAIQKAKLKLHPQK